MRSDDSTTPLDRLCQLALVHREQGVTVLMRVLVVHVCRENGADPTPSRCRQWVLVLINYNVLQSSREPTYMGTGSYAAGSRSWT